MKFKIIALMLPLLLASCGTTNSDFKACKVTAPNVLVYSAKVQEQAAKEAVGGSCPVLAGFSADYYVMRQQSRLILKGK